jgi:hypothetical protein
MDQVIDNRRLDLTRPRPAWKRLAPVIGVESNPTGQSYDDVAMRKHVISCS